jgi:D-alanyl-D-alanine carboxypeptidase/D-alanyl-D-alanine-endopeptidase (penicillin-binding protein 4)
MGVREQRHASGWIRTVLSWFPDAVVVLLVAAAFANLQFDLDRRWFGLDEPDPARQPAQVLPPEGLDLAVGAATAPVAGSNPGDGIAAAAVRQALAPFVDDASLGPRVDVAVAELATGTIVYRRGVGAITPASTTKLLTGAAALTSLGPMATFSTSVRQDGRRIVLVGGGDPFLATSRATAKGLYPVRATLDELAATTVAELDRQGLGVVRLSYDDSLFDGPAVNPAWPASYVTENIVPPITALWADQAELPGPGTRYASDPSRAAAETFAAALARRGITVRGPVAPRVSAPTDAEIAAVRSAPLGQIVERMMAVSDNNAAEVLAHHVGLATRQDASFVGGAAATLEVLQGLGVDTTGSTLSDGSGLSRQNLLTPEILLGVLQAASSDRHPALRQVVTGLPVAGFVGSLQSRFDDAAEAARGRVRAKTGTLTGVHGLAGIVTDLDGNRMAFVVLADRVDVPQTLAARRTLDQIAGALAACRCGNGSALEPGPSSGSTS